MKTAAIVILTGCAFAIGLELGWILFKPHLRGTTYEFTHAGPDGLILYRHNKNTGETVWTSPPTVTDWRKINPLFVPPKPGDVETNL